MSYHPYSSPGRALRQLYRHGPAPRRLSAFEQRLAEQANAALAGAAVALRPWREAMIRMSQQQRST